MYTHPTQVEFFADNNFSEYCRGIAYRDEIICSDGRVFSVDDVLAIVVLQWNDLEFMSN